MSEEANVRKLEAVKRSLAIANRVTSAAIVEARKGKRKKSVGSTGKKRSASPGKTKKSKPQKRGKSKK